MEGGFRTGGKGGGVGRKFRRHRGTVLHGLYVRHVDGRSLSIVHFLSECARGLPDLFLFGVGRPCALIRRECGSTVLGMKSTGYEEYWV